MGRRLWVALSVGAVVLAGCSPSQSADEAPDSGASAEAIADVAVSETPAAATAAGATESSSEPVVAEADSATSTPTEGASEQASDDSSETSTDSQAPAADADTDGERRNKGLAAVGRNAQGNKVERLQKRLAKLGFAPGPVDGAYGPQTEAAVEAFQQFVGVKQNGRANAQTVAALADFETDAKVLEAGDKGKAVKQLQRRLADGPLDPGKTDGSYGPQTVQAVWALEKLAGVPVDGNWGPLDEQAMQRLERGELVKPAESHKKRWVEFDLSKQVMTVYDPGSFEPVLISHGSSGSGVPWQNEEHSGDSITSTGSFKIDRRIDGWRESSLDIGRLYNPLYFDGGIAFHGATSVPLYPASHGCIRLPMHIADYLPDELPNGTPVHVMK